MLDTVRRIVRYHKVGYVLITGMTDSTKRCDFRVISMRSWWICSFSAFVFVLLHGCSRMSSYSLCSVGSGHVGNCICEPNGILYLYEMRLRR